MRRRLPPGQGLWYNTHSTRETMGGMHMELTGARVTLREFRREDVTPLRSWMADRAVTKQLGGAFLLPYTWEQTEAYLGRMLGGDAGGLNLVIADRDHLKYLGQVSLMMVDQLARKAELAIVLPQARWGQGLGGEALALVLDFAFDQMNLNRVFLKVHADNERAIRCYQKCGFSLEGRLRQEAFKDGAYVDVLVMGLLREEWRARAGGRK